MDKLREIERCLLDEVARLRAGIEYALEGPDRDISGPVPGRAIDCCKSILRDVLAGTEGYRG